VALQKSENALFRSKKKDDEEEEEEEAQDNGSDLVASARSGCVEFTMA
jgi:hypothetical protein